MKQKPPEFSVIVCSIDPEKFAAISGNYARVMGRESYEIIGIHDAKSLCEGYNRGFQQSSGRIVIFCHDDIEILTSDFPARLRRHLKRADIVGPAGTSYLMDGFWARAGTPFLHGQVGHHQPDEPMPYYTMVYDIAKPARAGVSLIAGLQALDGLLMAAKREVMDRVRFDEATFDGFHGYDVDFSYSAYLAGVTLGVFSDIAILHYSHGNFGDEWQKYNERFKAKHRDALPPLCDEPGGLGAKVLYRDKESLAASFELQAQRRLAVKLATLTGEGVDASEETRGWQALKIWAARLLARIRLRT